jgi:hypothetical protein
MGRFSLAGGALVLVACASGNYDPSDPRLASSRLEIVGPSTFSLERRAPADLVVRYSFDDGTAISGAPIVFAFQGDSADAGLSAGSVETGDDGTARVRLRGSTTDATFSVKATAPSRADATFMVAVSADPAGSIAIELRYAGTQTFDDFVPYLYRGISCDAIDPDALPMALREGAPASRLTDRMGFVGVPEATDYVVAVIARIAGQPAAFGCNVGIEVRPVAETRVVVDLLDHEAAARFAGTYDLSNTFDFSGALPGSVATALEILGELTDDQSIDGNVATEDFGQDPGAFVTDMVMRQTCAWECTSGEDYSSCSEIDHELGDLRDLYLEDFTRWSGAQSRFFGGCGAWEVVGRTAQNLVNQQIDRYVPEIVLRFLDSTGDLSRAITNARIQSELILTEPDAGGMSMFAHRLVTMEVSLRDLGGREHFYTFDLEDVGVGTLMTADRATIHGRSLVLPAHSFELHFGELVQYIYLNGILPLFGFTSTADMFRDWIDCPAIASRLYMETRDTIPGISVTDYTNACNRGIDAVGTFVDDHIDGLVDSAAVFTLSGEAQGGDLTPDGLAQTLESGVWTGSWDEMGTRATISGTFLGTLRLGGI